MIPVMNLSTPDLIVIGGGLAGCESAWQAAIRGIRVTLYEMRPEIQTGAHVSDGLAELVCSNSLGSNLIDRASGLLKEECRRMGSLLISCAEQVSVPAGRALAVDRELFSQLVTSKIQKHPNISLIRKEMREVPAKPTIIASGPLTSNALASALAHLTGKDHLYFFDAVAPIVRIDTINLLIAYRTARYSQEREGDYLNCPLSKNEYYTFVEALLQAERVELKDFERPIKEGVSAGAFKYFEGCLPIEILAERNSQALAFGPMRPVGLDDPRSGKKAYAVVQLRQDNLAGSLYNLVGFQTNLKFSEQQRVFRLIPGLENADFERFGQMHRNTFLNSPECLQPTLQFINRPDLFFAGQITGVEGYVGNIATGLLAGINAALFLRGHKTIVLPRETMLGALCHYITHASAANFQPMKANYGILPELAKQDAIRGKQARSAAYLARSLEGIDSIVDSLLLNFA